MGFRANCWQSSLGEEYLKVSLSWTSLCGLCCWPCGAGLGKAVGPCPLSQGSRGVWQQLLQLQQASTLCSSTEPLHAGDVFPPAVGPCVLPESPFLLGWVGLCDLSQKQGQPCTSIVASLMEGQSPLTLPRPCAARPRLGRQLPVQRPSARPCTSCAGLWGFACVSLPTPLPVTQSLCVSADPGMPCGTCLSPPSPPLWLCPFPLSLL